MARLRWHIPCQQQLLISPPRASPPVGTESQAQHPNGWLALWPHAHACCAERARQSCESLVVSILPGMCWFGHPAGGPLGPPLNPDSPVYLVSAQKVSGPAALDCSEIIENGFA